MGRITELLDTAHSRSQAHSWSFAGALLPHEAHELMQLAPGTRLIDVRARAELELNGVIPMRMSNGNPGWAGAQLTFGETPMPPIRRATAFIRAAAHARISRCRPYRGRARPLHNVLKASKATSTRLRPQRTQRLEIPQPALDSALTRQASGNTKRTTAAAAARIPPPRPTVTPYSGTRLPTPNPRRSTPPLPARPGRT
jgi:hypothetical protein